MIRLLAGLIALGAVLTIRADEAMPNSPEEAHANAKPHTVVGEHGMSIASGVLDFSQVAAAEKSEGKKVQTPRAAHRHPTAPWIKNSANSTAQVTAADAVSVAAANVSSPPPSTNFLGTLDNDTGIPPDTMGAVGPRHIVVAVNTEFRVLTRGGQFISSMSLGRFWSSVGQIDQSDPHIYFDTDSGRWIITTIADFESPSASVLVGASRTDDPTGQWNLYKIDADSKDVVWADYPALGINHKWVVISANMFSNSNDQFEGAVVWAFDKNSLVTGAATLPFSRFAEPSGFTMQPAITIDKNEDTVHITEIFGPDTLRLSTVTGPVGKESLNVGTAIVRSKLGGWNLQGGMIGPQLGSTAGIDTGDSRMMNTVFRNGSIWTSHAIFFPQFSSATRATAQWWQINPNGTVIQQGRVEDPTGGASYAYPTITANRNNDVLLGYTKFSPTGYPSAAYSFRTATDPLNTMEGEVIFKAGESSYFKDFGSGRNRWGDFSATLVDPLNDLDVWTIQEYASSPKNNQSEWGVWWAMIRRSAPPDGVLELQVSPPSQTDIAAGQLNDFFAQVTDGTELVANATVVANIPGRPAITFRNDGVAPDQAPNDNSYAATFALNTPSESPIVFTASAPGKTSISVTNIYNIVARPPNDNFTNAAKIPSAGVFGENTIQVTNTFATTELNEPLHAGISNFRSLWWNYSYTGDSAAPILVDTSGSGPQVVVAVYTGTSLSALFPVVSTNAAPGHPAIVTFTAQPGATYRIAVAGENSGEKGIVRLRVQPFGVPDTTPPLLTVTFPPSGLVTNSPNILFSGTVVDPEPQASGVNSVLIEDLQTEPVNVIQATLNGTTWSANITLSEETNTFRVTAVDFSDNVSTPQEITIYYRPTATTNDLFGQARTLTPPSGVDFASNTNASTEFNEPLHGGNEGGHSLWWTYTPPSDGILLLSTAGSDFDTLLGLYTVNDPLDKSFSKLITVAENDDSRDRTDGTSEIAAAVQGGRLYYIAVDGYGGDTGNIRLEYTFQKTAVFPLTTSATGGGTVTPTSGDFPSGSAVTVVASPDKYRQFSRFVINQNGVITVFTNAPRYTFVMNGPVSVSAEFVAKQFADDFQTGDFSKLPYQISSSPTAGQHWIVATVETNSVTHETSLAARVRPNLPDSTTASLVLVTNLAPGIGSFEFSINTETNFDFFAFLVNGSVVGNWSGSMPWQTFFFDIPATNGPTRLEWRFTKDVALGPKTGDELVAIDNLDVKTVPPPAQVAPNLTVAADSTQATIVATGTPFADFVLETSADLKTWTPVAGSERNSGSSGVVVYIQPASTGAHFYRVKQL